MTALALNRCGCSFYHDQSANCDAVAYAYRRGQRRIAVEAMVARIAAMRFGEAA